MSSLDRFEEFTFAASRVIACLTFLVLGGNVLQAQSADAGLAWHVQGIWHVDGKGAPIREGDPIPPASLLQPAGDKAGAHSIAVLLPDGQHLLDECFTEADCARGFRVPALSSEPEAVALDMLARIQTVLRGSQDHQSSISGMEPAPEIPRDEAVAVLDTANRVHIDGLLAKLPAGHYSYDLRPLDRRYPAQLHRVLEKTAPSTDLALPAPGLYSVTISDAQSARRIDLLLAAIPSVQLANFRSFPQAKKLLAQWNTEGSGWPTHELLRAYLKSLMRE